MWKRWALYIAKLLVATAFIWWLVASGRLDFQPLAQGASPHLLALGLLLLAAAVAFQVVRWQLLLKAQGFEFSLARVARWVWIAEFFYLALPGGAGGEGARLYYVLKNAPGSRIAALSTFAVDRALGLLALLLLGALAFAVWLAEGGGEGPVAVMGAATTALLAGVLLIAVLAAAERSRARVVRWLPERLRRPVDQAALLYLRRRGILYHGFWLSLAAHIMLMAAFMVGARILGTDLSWLAVVLAVPLVVIANFLPVSPGGVGVGEAAASVLFAAFGVANGAAVMLVVRAWWIVIQLAGGAVYLVHRDPVGEVPRPAAEG
jgi:uncharacterized protein (TIRG00374 family)